MIQCAYCGKSLPDGAAFCTCCGRKVEPQTVPAEERTEPSPVVRPEGSRPQPQPTRAPETARQPAREEAKKLPTGTVVGIVAGGILFLAAAAWIFLPKEKAPSHGEAERRVSPSAVAESTLPAKEPEGPPSESELPEGELPSAPAENSFLPVIGDYTVYSGDFGNAAAGEGGLTVNTYTLGDAFFYTVSSARPGGDTAQISGNAPMNGAGEIYFDAMDDGNGNLVSGTLFLLDDGNIAVEATVTQWDRNAAWGLEVPYTELWPSSSYQDGEYLWPTDSRYITYADLDQFTKEEVVLIRNEIFARYGYSFKADNIRTYFAGKSWYSEDPNVNVNTFGTANMTDIERDNIDTIMNYERAKGWK